MRDPRFQTLGRLAARQHGAFTRRQALDVGLTRHEVDGRIRRGHWVAIERGTYRSIETPPSWRQRLASACLVGPAVASHRSAAALWRLPRFEEGIVEITAVRHRRRWQGDVIWHESVRLDDHECSAIDGIPVTGPTRTLLDLGSVVERHALLAAIDDAVRRRLTSIERLRAELHRWDPRRRGSGVVRLAIGQRTGDAVPASILESDFASLVEAFGLPRPCRQWPVRDEGGRVLARVDFAYPAARLVIEIDSLRHHAGPQDWRDDLQRQNVVMARGLRVLRFTAGDLRLRPDQVNATIRTALQAPDA